jgi:hypothetical protein
MTCRAGGRTFDPPSSPVEPERVEVRGIREQASKGLRWMPWRQEAMKDVVRCEKRRGAANRR